jgi:hypothetical protein
MPLLHCMSLLLADFVAEVGCEGRIARPDDFFEADAKPLLAPAHAGRLPDALELALATQLRRYERDAHATHAIGMLGGGRATSFASLRKFCAMAANVNSNWAPLGPRRRNRLSRRMRFRCANSISTFLRSRRDCANASVLARARAMSRAASFTSRTIRRTGMFGQHFSLSGHARHSGTETK